MKIEIDLDIEKDTMECELCHKPICTYQNVQLIIKGEFSLTIPSFQQSDKVTYQHDNCEDVE